MGKNSYEMTIEVAGIKYKTEAKTIDEAFCNLNLTWQQVKFKGIVHISKGRHYCKYLFPPMQLRRIFINKIVRSTWDKRLNLLLKAKT